MRIIGWWACLACSAVCGAAALSLADATAAQRPQELRDRMKASIDVGIRYLRFQQQENGSWDDSSAATALVLRAMMESHRQYRESDGPFIRNGLQYLAEKARPDGSIGDSEDRVYETALAVLPLQASENPGYQKLIESATTLLIDEVTRQEERHGYRTADSGHGPTQGTDPGLPRFALVLEALRAADLPADHAVWQGARQHVDRSPIRASPARVHALLVAGVDRRDPIVARGMASLETAAVLEEGGGPLSLAAFRDAYFLASTLVTLGDSITSPGGPAASGSAGAELAERLMDLQDFEGYWALPDATGEARFLACSFAILALEQIYNND